MKTLLTFVFVNFLFVLTYAQTKCDGHENDIKNGQLERAESMGMKVNSITVTYLGNCLYKCISDIDDPGINEVKINSSTSIKSSAQKIKSTIIYKWEGNKYTFVRKEEG